MSVTVQAREGEAYAAQRWPELPVEIYTDNDLSAAKAGVERPDYLRLLDDIRLGAVAQLVCREQSRLTRQPAEWEQLVAALHVAGIDEVHTTMQGVVSVAPANRLTGRILAAVDAEEAERTSARIRLAHQGLIAEGRHSGRAPYGYRRTLGDDGRTALEPDPETSPVVRTIFERVADGWSFGEIGRALEADGIPTPRGAARWHRETLAAIVRSPTHIAKRTHHGEIVGPAAWEPIVDADLFNRAQAAMAATKVTSKGRVVHAQRTVRPGQRRYLLTGGLAVCAHCDTPLIASRQGQRSGGTLPAYACPHPSRAGGGCGHCSIIADRLEAHVIEQVGEWLARDDLVIPVATALDDGDDTAALRAELEEVDSKMAALAEQWAAGDIGDLERAAARRVLDERRQAITARLGRAAPSVPVLSVGELRAEWAEGSLVARRAVIGSLCRPAITVASAHRDGRRLSIGERVGLNLP